MKTLFAKLTLAALAAVPSAAVYAQNSYDIVYGRATVTFSSAVLQQFTSRGIAVTNLALTPLQSGINVLPVLEGAIDLDTSLNEVVYGGGYEFKVGSTVIQVRNLTLDLFGPSAIFYGLVIENGAVVGREAIFSIVAQGGPPALPIVPVNGTISHNGLSLSFGQPFVALLNSAGNSGLNATATVGTLDLFSVLAPLTGNTWAGPYAGPNPGPYPTPNPGPNPGPVAGPVHW